MSDFFFYGTLCHVPLLEVVLGYQSGHLDHRLSTASLAHHRVSWVKDQAFPMIEKEEQHTALGLVLTDVTEDEESLLSYYEGAFSYHLSDVVVQSQGNPQNAVCFYPMSSDQTRGAKWKLEDWERVWGEMAVGAARDVMIRRERYDAQSAATMRPFLMARHWARIMAKNNPSPTAVRHKPKASDVTINQRMAGHRGFFELAEFQYQHTRFDGTQSPEIAREAFLAFDAALVLPYDPQLDQILLVEQLRYGPLWREDPHPWIFEPIAGLVDAGEDPVDTARREALEEAGLKLGPIEPMVNVYASPGYSTEFFHCFLAVSDLSEFQAGLGGLQSENEDIRSHVLAFDDAMALVKSGEINAGPLVMMLYWLAAERTRLRSAA